MISNTSWISIIECICASGTVITLTVIVIGGVAQFSWALPNGERMPDWHYQSTMRGWCNQSVTTGWFHDVSLHETTPSGDRWRLLVLGGFKTHVNDDFQALAISNRVILCYLTPHTFLHPSAARCLRLCATKTGLPCC